eukprot:Gb_28635 [translate_table: standard]
MPSLCGLRLAFVSRILVENCASNHNMDLSNVCKANKPSSTSVEGAEASGCQMSYNLLLIAAKVPEAGLGLVGTHIARVACLSLEVAAHLGMNILKILFALGSNLADLKNSVTLASVKNLPLCAHKIETESDSNAKLFSKKSNTEASHSTTEDIIIHVLRHVIQGGGGAASVDACCYLNLCCYLVFVCIFSNEVWRRCLCCQAPVFSSGSGQGVVWHISAIHGICGGVLALKIVPYLLY